MKVTFKEVMKELYEQKVVLSLVTNEDIKQIIRRGKGKTLEQIINAIKIVDYNLVSEEINSYLGY